MPGGRPGPRYVLDACLDTAPFGAGLADRRLPPYDDLVIEEAVEGENQVADPEIIARYEKDFGLLREAATRNRDAVPVIQRSLEDLREGPT